MAGQNPGPAHHPGRRGDCLGRVGPGVVVRVRGRCCRRGVRCVAAGPRRDVRSRNADRWWRRFHPDPHPGLLARDVDIDHQDVASVTYAEPALNQPPGETLFSLLGRGGYLRIELRDPRVLPGVRWTNYVWCLRAESDPNYIAPPLPRTETAVLAFHTSPATADAVLRLFAT